MQNNMNELVLPEEFSPSAKLYADPVIAEIEQLGMVLKPQEQAAVNELATKIDLSNSISILQYGTAAQGKMTGFADSALQSVRGKDLGEVGKMVTDLVGELRDFDVNEEQKGVRGWFRKAGKNAGKLQARFEAVTGNLDRIVQGLEGHKIGLLKDISMMDKMYELDLAYCKELTMYIMAGKKKMEETRNVHLRELNDRAAVSHNQEDIQRAKDLAEMLDRFEKRIFDLELTRTIAVQMAPQIRLVQVNDSVMVDKIQSSISNTIPLWKNQMVLALGMIHTQSAIEAQRQVNEITNKMLLENSAALKTHTIEAARESERGIVDVETLVKTNEDLITTLSEVVRIHDEGRIRRHNAEQELVRIEGELKSKMLEISQRPAYDRIEG